MQTRLLKSNNSLISLRKVPQTNLMASRICDLALKIRGSSLESYIFELREELKKSGLSYLNPHFYLGDEWFSPEGTKSISIPFWLADERLQNIERNYMRSVEGGTKNWFLKLLRHETGHCFDHGYQFSKTPEWQNLFGDPSQEYSPDHYTFNKFSKDFVTNLGSGYGQSHPDEDFAETFAVVLNPKSNWRFHYRNKLNAFKKLLYVESLILQYGQEIPISVERSEMCAARKMRQTLHRYYLQRKRPSKALSH